MTTETALDSRAVLGLLAKAHEVFSGEGATLSFPLGSPVSFDADAFLAAMGPAPDAAGHALLAEFSTMMNWIPGGVVWPPVEPRTLDEVVRYILGQATWASGNRSPAEEARAVEAKALVDLANPLMQEYAARKDAWIRSREQLRNNPEDLAAQEAERTANTALLSCPGRDDIERAMDDLVALDDRAPYRTREQMQRQIDVGTGTFDDPSGGRFSPVRPLPREVIAAPNWDSVTLDRAALDALAAGAPQVLTDHLRLDEASEDPILSITFEYASAQLHRQWLDERILQLRCWRFDDGRVLSDGGTPAAGDCTSYVRAIVLARNVSVTSKAPPGAPPAAPPESLGFMVAERADSAQHWDAVLTEAKAWEDPRYLVAAAQVEPPVVESPVVESLVESVPAVSEEVVQPVEYQVQADLGIARALRIQPLAALSTDAIAEPADVAFADGGQVRFAAASLRGSAARFHAAPEVLISDQFVQETSSARNFEYIFQPVTAEQPAEPPPAADSGTITFTTPPGQLILLALICKEIDRSPNPDPDYAWS